jgi:TonB family protein
VWIEPVNKSHISKLKITPDLDHSSFDILVESPDSKATAEISVLDGDKVVASQKASTNKLVNVFVENPKLWSPKSPFLYDLKITLSKDGKIVDVEVVRSGGDPSLDKEAVRVIKSMPNWKPGQQRGKPVRVKYTVPVNFRLQ